MEVCDKNLNKLLKITDINYINIFTKDEVEGDGLIMNVNVFDSEESNNSHS